jgi:CheY-like chemotaxis protein
MKTSRILIVDDEPIIRLVLGQWLRSQGSEVTEVDSIAEADRSLAAQGYDLIISDVHLTGNSGLQWTERLLSKENATPVVLITGSPELETAMRAANLPVSGYIAKPPNFQDLGALLQRTLTERRQRQTLHAMGGMVAGLLEDPTWATDDPRLRQTMVELGACLTAASVRQRRSTGSDAATGAWRGALLETIAVLEKTKSSFRSKELGRLRQNLRAFLTENQAA